MEPGRRSRDAWPGDTENSGGTGMASLASEAALGGIQKREHEGKIGLIRPCFTAHGLQRSLGISQAQALAIKDTVHALDRRDPLIGVTSPAQTLCIDALRLARIAHPVDKRRDLSPFSIFTCPTSFGLILTVSAQIRTHND